MELEHGKLFFRTRGSQFDWNVLSSIGYGIMIGEADAEMTDEQKQLARRINEAEEDVNGQLFSLSPAEARVAAEAIRQCSKVQASRPGSLLLKESIATAQQALPAIEELAQTAQS